MHIAHETYGDKDYKVANGTYYHIETPDAVIRELERLRGTDTRVRIFCGDVTTGKAWTEEWHNMGRIGRSTGRIKIPLLIANARSMGGPGLLEHCILGIRLIGGGRPWLYKNPKLDIGAWTASELNDPVNYPTYKGEVYHDGELYARCATLAKAQRLAEYMAGKRDAK